MEEKTIGNMLNIKHSDWSSCSSYFDFLLQISTDIVILLSPAYEIIGLSNEAEKYFNQTKDTILGQNFFKLTCSNIYFKNLLSHIEKLAFKINFQDISESSLSPSGCQSITINWSGTYLLNPSSETFGFIVIGRKTVITSAIKAQEENIQKNFDALINAIPGSFYCKDKDGVYLLCNKTVLEKGNLKIKEEIIGKTDYDVWPELAEKLTENDKVIIATGKTMELEETVILPDGKKMYFASVKMPLKDENGKSVGVIGNSLDITELKEAKEKAEKANIIKTEFIHNMEHDIRTPFNGIWALAEILYQEETDPKKKEYLGDIAQSGRELLDFCNVILDFSRIEMGVFPVFNNKFDINEVLKKAVHIEQPAIKQKGLNFILKQDPNLPQFVIGDDYRLLRILLNLLSNSIKFTNEGCISLIVNVVTIDKQKATIKFAVKDTGIGIPEDKQDFIYDKFSRLNPSSKGEYKGFGLGLRIVKQFIKEMQGEIKVRSEINIGTEFEFYLPFNLLADPIA